jgi:hypothetical protein
MEIIRNVIRDIRPEYWVALGAVVSILSLLVAGFSLIYVRRSAKASREQTRQQKQAAKDAAQPMLWVDMRGDDGQGQALVLLLGNSGPSIARNVKVVFDPAPPSTLDIKPILEILKQGIASLPPGRTMQWALGAAHNSSDWDAHNAYRVRIEAEGPFGLLPTTRTGYASRQKDPSASSSRSSTCSASMIWMARVLCRRGICMRLQLSCTR